MSTVLLEQEQKSGKTNGKQKLSNLREDFLYIDVRTPQEFEGGAYFWGSKHTLARFTYLCGRTEDPLTGTPHHVGVPNTEPGKDSL